MRRWLRSSAALAASLLLAPQAEASWPPKAGADLTSPSSWPNDPEYASLWQLFSYLPRQAAGTSAYLPSDVMLGASGMSVDEAWESTVGSPAVRIVVLDSGIEWDELDLAEQVWLNPGELGAAHMPETATGGTCGGAGVLKGYDCNGDGVFTVADYANDPRISPVVPGATCTDPSTGETKLLIAGDVNENCVLDAGDLIALFSDGIDDDANGYTDDIAGWDFFADDNDPYDDTRNGHGTTAALQAAAAGNNGVEGIGVCPGCRVVPLRVGDSAVVDSNDLAKGLVYLADSASGGAEVALAAVSAINMSAYARAAVDYAYGKGVVVVASMGDENSRHHVEPASGAHVLSVHGIGLDGASLTTSTSFLDYDNCTNFGGQLALSASSAGCSDEAAARTAGELGLVQAFAAAASPPLKLTAEEQIQLAKTTADVVNVPESRQPGTTLYESLPGFSQRFGYGRPNAASALAALSSGLIPPEVDLLSPTWFTTLYASGTTGPVPVVGRVVAARAPSYDVTVDWAPGVEPQASDFVPLASPVTNVPGQTVSGGESAPLALLDPSAIDTAHTADPDSPQHENDRTITIRVQAVAHYPSGDVTGEARRTVAIVNEENGLDPDLLPGFPVALSGSSEGGVKLVDVNGDGVRDLVIATNDGFVHAISVKGSSPEDVPGFPYALRPVDGLDPSAPDPSIPSYLPAPAYTAGSNGGVDPTVARESIDGAPAIGAVTGAANVLVFVSWAGTVYVVDFAGHDVAGFPLRLPRVPSCPDDPAAPRPAGDCMDTMHDFSRGAFASPVLADMDGDGVPDIIVAAFDGNVYVFHGDGTVVPGFPVRVHATTAYRYDRIMSTPAVGDLNGDGVPDIVVGSNETLGDDGDVGFYFVVDGRGTSAPGTPYLPHWPLQVATTYLAPITGVGTTASPVILPLASASAVDALLQVAGSPVVVPLDPGPQHATTPPPTQLPANDGGTPGFAPPSAFGSLSPATADQMLPLFSHPSVGDLDQDGVPDVVMGGEGRSLEDNLGAKTAVPFQHLLAMWNGKTGQMFPGSPVVVEDYSFMTSQAIADIDGDGYPEVIAGTGGYFVHAVDACGHESAGWPKFTGGWTMGTPAVGDVTGEGLLDVVATTREGYLYAWATRAVAHTAVVQWESFHHDNANTGNYATPLDQGVLLAAPSPLDCSDIGQMSSSSSQQSPSASHGCGCRVAVGWKADGGEASAVLAILAALGARRRRRASLG